MNLILHYSMRLLALGRGMHLEELLVALYFIIDLLPLHDMVFHVDIELRPRTRFIHKLPSAFLLQVLLA